MAGREHDPRPKPRQEALGVRHPCGGATRCGDNRRTIGAAFHQHVGVPVCSHDQGADGLGQRIGELARITQPFARCGVHTLIDHPDSARFDRGRHRKQTPWRGAQRGFIFYDSRPLVHY